MKRYEANFKMQQIGKASSKRLFQTIPMMLFFALVFICAGLELNFLTDAISSVFGGIECMRNTDFPNREALAQFYAFSLLTAIPIGLHIAGNQSPYEQFSIARYSIGAEPDLFLALFLSIIFVALSCALIYFLIELPCLSHDVSDTNYSKRRRGVPFSSFYLMAMEYKAFAVFACTAIAIALGTCIYLLIYSFLLGAVAIRTK